MWSEVIGPDSSSTTTSSPSRSIPAPSNRNSMSSGCTYRNTPLPLPPGPARARRPRVEIASLTDTLALSFDHRELQELTGPIHSSQLSASDVVGGLQYLVYLRV